MRNYQHLIEKHLKIVNKSAHVVPLELNPIQARYLNTDRSQRDIVLKARQQGFSSLILAIFTIDFLFEPNAHNVVVADIADNAIALLERVKFYIKAFEEVSGVKVPLKYNSKYELFNEPMNSKYTIGTAENAEFGRSRTITNLHLSEAAFYPQFQRVMAGALQAVTPEGYAVIETTANGFNEFKTFWDEAKNGESNFQPLFYSAGNFYSEDFLNQKKKELGRLYQQEYPETAMEAFLTSGDCYFSQLALTDYLKAAMQPVTEHVIYG